MSVEHQCVEHRQRAVWAEGDDFYTERCTLCGKTRYEGDGIRVMAWIATPGSAWPWKYAYPDPVAGDVWRAASQEGERP